MNYGIYEKRLICEEDFYKLYPLFDLSFYILLYKESIENKYTLMYNYHKNCKIEGRLICEEDFYKLYPFFDLNYYEKIFSHLFMEGIKDKKYILMRFHAGIIDEDDFYKLYPLFDLDLYKKNNRIDFPDIEAIYHYLYYNEKSNETSNETSKKILHLVLYSKNEIYDEMYKITREYYNNFDDVKTVYYILNNEIEEEYLLEGDILSIKGEESFLPGILYKTLETFKYFSKDINNYEYVIRSNISTIINFKILLNNLNNKNISYGGGNKLNLQWICQKSGVIDKSLFNLNFFQGTCIILNRYLFNLLMKYENEIRRDIIDDLAICLFIQQKIRNISMECYCLMNLLYFNENYNLLIEEYKEKIIIYRNNHREINKNNKIDITNMNYIINKIL
jgi:hypothetical protein